MIKLIMSVENGWAKMAGNHVSQRAGSMPIQPVSGVCSVDFYDKHRALV